MLEQWPAKDPDSVEPFFLVWCDKTGLNDGSALDNGELQGATISTVEWTIPTGLTKDADNTSTITIKGVVYPVNTVATVWLSGGTADTNYDISCKITTDDGRTLQRSVHLRVKEL